MNKNVFYRLGFGYGTTMITLLNHELSGHGLRSLEFKCKPHGLETNPLLLSGSMLDGCIALFIIVRKAYRKAESTA